MDKSTLSKLYGAAVIFAVALSGCSKTSNSENLSGTFTGVDGSSDRPSKVSWNLAVTGDDLITGSWSSDGEIKRAQISGSIGFFSNDVLLVIEDGICKGEFKGTLKFHDSEVSGKFDDNPNCPQRSYSFTLKKSS